MATDGFFAVGADTFHSAVALGITEATAFLVLARGAGPDNVTTLWGGRAVAARTGTQWSTANGAVDRLAAAKLVKASGTKGRPNYILTKQGDDIWLPNTLVDGLAGQPAPVERIRQLHDPMLLRLLVDLYSDQNLLDHGGISTKVVYTAYEHKRLGAHAQYVIWGFARGMVSAYHTGAVSPHARDATDDERAAGHHWSADAFFRRFDRLQSLGLVELVPMLYDGEQGDPIHPMHGDSRDALEASLAAACERAGYRALSLICPETCDANGWPEIVAIVPSHIEQVTMVGTYRLAYRPQAAMTSAWWGQMLERAPECIRRYNEIAADSSSSS